MADGISFLDKNTAVALQTAGRIADALTAMRQMRWNYALEKAKLNYELSREEDRQRWEEKLESLRNTNRMKQIEEAARLRDKQVLATELGRAADEVEFSFGVDASKGLKAAREVYNTTGDLVAAKQAFYEAIGLTPQDVMRMQQSRFPQPATAETMSGEAAANLLEPLDPEMAKWYREHADKQFSIREVQNARMAAATIYKEGKRDVRQVKSLLLKNLGATDLEGALTILINRYDQAIEEAGGKSIFKPDKETVPALRVRKAELVSMLNQLTRLPKDSEERAILESQIVEKISGYLTMPIAGEQPISSSRYPQNTEDETLDVLAKKYNYNRK